MEARLKGHRLRDNTLAYGLREQLPRRKIVTPGAAFCECGAYSPTLPSVHERAAWHRQHIADVISGKTRLL